MALINSSYFIGEKNIPNTEYSDVSSLIDHLIGVHEKDFLIKTLGYELYKLFETGLLENNPDQKWLDIRNGKVFTGLNGKQKQWKGLVSTNPVPESPITDYVYYWYMRNQHSQTAGMGEVQTKTEYADSVSPALKMTRAWNDMVRKMIVLKEFLIVNYTIYPEFQYQSGSKELKNLLTTINPYF